MLKYLRTCKTELKKQVLPKLSSPFTPCDFIDIPGSAVAAAICAVYNDSKLSGGGYVGIYFSVLYCCCFVFLLSFLLPMRRNYIRLIGKRKRIGKMFTRTVGRLLLFPLYNVSSL